MGYYINPKGTTKEAWLVEHGEPTHGPAAITETHLPVVLVNNGIFNAAGVAIDERELEAFTQPHDTRPKLWFRVSRADLQAVGAI